MRKKVSDKTFCHCIILNKVYGLLLLYLFMMPDAAKADTAPEYQVKAAFLYNFIRFIDWPPDAFSSPEAPFVIGILGNDPFGRYIDEIVKGEKAGNHPIVVQRYRNIKDIVHCHILFINTGEAIHLKEILSFTDRRSILTVSDSGNFTASGGIIGFFKEENKVRLQINIASARNAQLDISSKLLSLARIVNPATN